MHQTYYEDQVFVLRRRNKFILILLEIIEIITTRMNVNKCKQTNSQLRPSCVLYGLASRRAGAGPLNWGSHCSLADNTFWTDSTGRPVFSDHPYFAWCLLDAQDFHVDDLRGIIDGSSFSG